MYGQLSFRIEISAGLDKLFLLVFFQVSLKDAFHLKFFCVEQKLGGVLI